MKEEWILEKNLGVDPERLYPDYKTMFAEEAKREDGIEVVDICNTKLPAL